MSLAQWKRCGEINQLMQEWRHWCLLRTCVGCQRFEKWERGKNENTEIMTNLMMCVFRNIYCSHCLYQEWLQYIFSDRLKCGNDIFYTLYLNTCHLSSSHQVFLLTVASAIKLSACLVYLPLHVFFEGLAVSSSCLGALDHPIVGPE